MVAAALLTRAVIALVLTGSFVDRPARYANQPPEHSSNLPMHIDARDGHSGRRVRFRAVGAQGLFRKILRIRGVIVGETAEKEFATIEYGGLEKGITNMGWITIDNVREIYIRMDIDVAYTTPFTRPTMRSDDPTISSYFFYKHKSHWTQRPPNERIDVFADTNCQISEQSWEDGGGFEIQDFFFQVQVGQYCDAIVQNDRSLWMADF
jgi:hypothetical protein